MDNQQTYFTQPALMTSIRFLVSLLLLLPALSHALPPEFTATYDAKAYGMTVARSTYTLKHKKNGIIFTQQSAPTGLASIFSDEELEESSDLSLYKNRLLLNEYRYIQKGSKKNRNIHLKIKWENSLDDKVSGTVSGTAGNETVQLELTTPVWDTLSFQIPIMTSFDSNTQSQEHAMLVKGELKTYTFITHGAEKIDVGNKTIKTVKVEIKSDNNKPLFLWISPELRNLPVKIEKWKSGKPNITMQLDSATFPSDKNIRFSTEVDFDDL